MDQGGLEQLETWLDQHPDARMIVIDVFKKVRQKMTKETRLYDADYEAALPLQELAGRRQIAILVIHHTRKADAEDPLDAVSGSVGLVGACDTVMVLKKQMSKADGVLYIRDRDVEEAEKALNMAYRERGERIKSRIENQEFSEALQEIASLRPAVDRFFDDVLVMAEEPELRDNRLSLLSSIGGLFAQIADFRKIVSNVSRE